MATTAYKWMFKGILSSLLLLGIVNLAQAKIPPVLTVLDVKIQSGKCNRDAVLKDVQDHCNSKFKCNYRPHLKECIESKGIVIYYGCPHEGPTAELHQKVAMGEKSIKLTCEKE